MFADFTYDGDGNMVKAVMQTSAGAVTTLFVNALYQVRAGVVTKYYQGGAFRVDGTLYFALGDHLGSTSITTNGLTGAKLAELR